MYNCALVFETIVSQLNLKYREEQILILIMS